MSDMLDWKYKCNRSDCDAPVEHPREYCGPHSIVNPPETDQPFDWDALNPVPPTNPDVEKAVSDIAAQIKAREPGYNVTHYEAYMLGSLAARQLFKDRKDDVAWISGFMDTAGELRDMLLERAQALMDAKAEAERGESDAASD